MQHDSLIDIGVSIFVGLVFLCPLLLVWALILSKTVPLMPNRMWRFVLLFVMGVPFFLAYGYIRNWSTRVHQYHWTESLILSLILSLLFAAWKAFWVPE
jgi:hypothetical protein